MPICFMFFFRAIFYILYHILLRECKLESPFDTRLYNSHKLHPILKTLGSKSFHLRKCGAVNRRSHRRGKRQDLQGREAVVGFVAEISLFRSQGQESLFTLHNPIIQYKLSFCCYSSLSVGRRVAVTEQARTALSQHLVTRQLLGTRNNLYYYSLRPESKKVLTMVHKAQNHWIF
jgi:hypothetical protein